MQLIAKTVHNGSLLLLFQINESEKHYSQSHLYKWASPPPGSPLNRDKDLQLNAAVPSTSESRSQAVKIHARILSWNPVWFQMSKEVEKKIKIYHLGYCGLQHWMQLIWKIWCSLKGKKCPFYQWLKIYACWEVKWEQNKTNETWIYCLQRLHS